MAGRAHQQCDESGDAFEDGVEDGARDHGRCTFAVMAMGAGMKKRPEAGAAGAIRSIDFVVMFLFCSFVKCGGGWPRGRPYVSAIAMRGGSDKMSR